MNAILPKWDGNWPRCPYCNENLGFRLSKSAKAAEKKLGMCVWCRYRVLFKHPPNGNRGGYEERANAIIGVYFERGKGGDHEPMGQ